MSATIPPIKQHPRNADWICHRCATEAGATEIPHHVSTWHNDTCGVCGNWEFVTEPRDFRWPTGKCRCGNTFFKFNSLQNKCVPCLVEKGKQLKAKADRKDRKAKREKLKTRSEYVKEAQAAFNAFIRTRDRELPCISCGHHHQGQWHAGHYRTTRAAPELRFDSFNCHKQCAPCNDHLSGNIVEYRINLIKKIGREKVEWLEGPHEAKHYTIDQLKELRKFYKDKTKELKEAQT